MHDVLVIYKQLSLQFDEEGNLKPMEGMPVHTLSYDEKPGMQALNTTVDDKPPVPGTEKNSTVYRDYEYVRLGTLSLLAAIDLLTGEAIPLVSPTHKSSAVVRFLKILDATCPLSDKSRRLRATQSGARKEEMESRIYQYFDEINKVPVPYHWSYKLDDIDLNKEDISKIVYEVVNHKAANACDKEKRAPKLRTRKRKI